MEQKLGVSEITGVVLESLTMGSHESLLEVSGVPNPLFHGSSAEERGAFLDKLVSAHLDVFIEQIATENLLAIFVVEQVACDESSSEGKLGNELEIFVVEEHVVVIEEQESSQGGEHHEFFVVRIVDVKVCHVIIPFSIVGVKEHSIKREFRANSLNDIQQIEHLLD